MNVTDVDDEYLKLASEGVQKITDAALPGKFWVEFAPIFRHVPGWIPGASFKRYVKDVNPKIDELLGRPFEAVKRDWVRRILFMVRANLLLMIIKRRRVTPGLASRQL